MTAAARPGRRVSPIRDRWPATVSLLLVSLVSVMAFTWPFFVDPQVGAQHGQDAPWLFALLLGLLGMVVLAEMASGGLDAKTVAVLGVLAAMGGALRVLSAGTAGLEPVFFLVILAGRVLGRSMGFVVGALAVVTGAFLTGGVGPWLPFQMIATGWVGMGAGMLPRAHGRPERWMLAAYGAGAALLFGAVMNLWFWPFMGPTAPQGAGYVPDGGLALNLGHYAVFYLTTSLAFDLPRAVLSAVLILLAGRAVLLTLRRAVRRAAFDAEVTFTEPERAAGSEDHPGVPGR